MIQQYSHLKIGLFYQNGIFHQNSDYKLILYFTFQLVLVEDDIYIRYIVSYEVRPGKSF